MHKINELILNGKSTADFSFCCIVEENSPPVRAVKKDKLWETDHSNGYTKQSIEAYSPIEKSYKIYIHNITHKEFREFKAWVKDEGWLTPSDEPDLKYFYEAVDLEIDPLDEVNGYEIRLVFKCQPFGMEEEKTVPLGNEIDNHTNAPMYPLIIATVTNGAELTIGKQTMKFDVADTVNIECKHGYQDVIGTGGKKQNHVTTGDFFSIGPGKHKVIMKGISGATIKLRWGWR